jgi:hypothetical protein
MIFLPRALQVQEVPYTGTGGFIFVGGLRRISWGDEKLFKQRAEGEGERGEGKRAVMLLSVIHPLRTQVTTCLNAQLLNRSAQRSSVVSRHRGVDPEESRDIRSHIPPKERTPCLKRHGRCLRIIGDVSTAEVFERESKSLFTDLSTEASQS